VPDERERRLALNEALFRQANERAADWEERREDAEGTELYHCECADPECQEKISLGRSDYERIRGDSTHFFVRPGHEVPDVESVVERNDGWVVIEKDPETHGIVERADERT
jgi:hypothetical protein